MDKQMVEIYARRMTRKNNPITIEEVPEHLRKAVQDILKKSA